MAQKFTHKGATWDLLISKSYFKKPAENAASQIIDGSRLSTETIAPFIQHRMTDSTFISGIEVGRVNLLGSYFNQMKTLLLCIALWSPQLTY